MDAYNNIRMAKEKKPKRDDVDEITSVARSINPDYEPATKAYVKYLMRKFTNHCHKQRGPKYPTVTTAMFLGWIATIVCSIAGFSNTNPIPICAYWAPHFLIFSLICTLLVYESENSSIAQNTASAFGTRGDYPPEFKKFSIPECEEDERD